jgi:hypothetical protein
MRYGIESRMKLEKVSNWEIEMRRHEWSLLKWYERKKDRDKALEALTHRSNSKSSYLNFYEYRALDVKKPPKHRKRAKVKYPEYDENLISGAGINFC